MSRIPFVILTILASTPFCRAQMLEQPGLPFEISHARLESNIVTKEASLHLTLRNSTTSPLREITLGVLAWDSDGNPKAFQVSPARVNIRAGAIGDVIVPMSSLLYREPVPVAQFTAAVVNAVGEEESWRAVVPHRGFAAALRTGEPIPVEAMSAAETLAPGDCETDLCIACRADARCFCGMQVGCVKSYSCSRSTCTCAFECNISGICSAPTNCQ